MTFRVVCPHCNSPFMAEKHHVGKSGKCPKCGGKFVVRVPTQNSPERAEKPPTVPATAPPITKLHNLKKWQNWAWTPLVTALVGLLVGYYSGRAHVKHELKSGLNKIGKQVISDLESGFANVLSGDRGDSRSGAAENNDTQPPLSPGEVYSGEGFELTLSGLEITKPEVVDFLGNDAIAKEQALLVRIEIKNTSDRKVLRIRDETFTSWIRVIDDADNGLRGISYGISSKLKGSVTDDDDINPGDHVVFIRAFTVPLPKTEHLILTLDQEMLDGEGTVDFKVPVSRIVGFNQ